MTACVEQGGRGSHLCPGVPGGPKRREGAGVEVAGTLLREDLGVMGSRRRECGCRRTPYPGRYQFCDTDLELHFPG